MLVNELVTPRFSRKIKLKNHRLKTTAAKPKSAGP
jgi:hypothetical protein